MPKIAIIGAGITGVTTAYALAKRGCEVTVFDRRGFPAMETSFANGGQLSASNAEVWNSWANIFKGISWMLKSDAPLLLNPMPSWHKYSWMAEFVSGIRKYEENTVKTVRLAIEARKHLFAIAEDEGIEFDLERRGILHFYKDKKSFEHARAVNRLLQEGGLDRQELTPDEIRQKEPTLEGSSFYGGFFTESDSTGDIHKFTVGLAEACRRRGVSFIFDAQVESIRPGKEVQVVWLNTTSASDQPERSSLTFDRVVICAGAASRGLAASLGDRVNVYPVKGYSITVLLNDPKSQEATPWISLLDDDAKIVTSRLGVDRFRVAGTAEFSGYNLDIREERIRPLTNWVRRLFPEICTRQVIPWAGLRPMMPDMLPRVLRGKRPGIFYNTGHGHLGWTLSAATAEMVACEVMSSAESPKIGGAYLGPHQTVAN